MTFTQLQPAFLSRRLLAAARAHTASFVSMCRHAAACLRSLPAMLLTFGVLSGTTASAQTARLSQVQTVLNIPSALQNAMGLAVDSSGNIYIADQDNKRVLKLTPSGGGFVQSTIGTGLGLPYGIAVDAGGSVYIADIQLSTLLKETPNGSGGYTQSTIGSDLYDAVSVAVDKHGNVFGIEDGALFKETLSGGVYTQSFLATPGSHGVFQVVVDGLGDLYLNDSYDNEVFEDVPLPGGGYATSQIPGAANSLAVDSNNNLYEAYYPGNPEGSSSYIYELTPNGSGGFTSTFIHADASFNDDDYYGINYFVDYFIAYGLTVDGNGSVFFIDGYTEELIEESPSPSSSSTNIGQIPVTGSSYPAALFFTFDTPGIMGSYSIVTDGLPNTEFTDSYDGSCIPPENYPTGYTCDIDVYFTPAAPGVRSGAVVLKDDNGNPFATAYVQGTGVSPLVAFPGAAPAPLITGLDTPLGMTVDASGNVIVANAGAGNVQLLAPGGAQSPLGTGFNNPTGVAENGAGNIFVAQSGSVYEIAMSTGVQTQLNLSGVTNPNDLAIDGAGNLYISEPNLSKVVKVTPSGVQSTVGTGLSAPRGIAVDAGGNVYIADYAAGSVFVVAPSGTQSTISGFGGPSGVAVDPAGNVYVAVYGSGELVEIAPGGARTTLAAGLANPYSVALDGNGNLYFSEYVSGDVRKIDRMDGPTLNFASTQIGLTSSDSPRTVTLSNNGNAALSFPIPTSGDSPSISANFALNSGGASDCPLVTSSSSSAATLATGASCSLPISFEPASGGNISGALTLTDNNLNAVSPAYATQSIELNGTGTAKPFGHIDSAVDSVTASSTIGQSDSVLLKGWTADQIDGAPLSNVKVYIDGNLAGTPTLGVARPDVAAAYNNVAYTNSGYTLSYSVAALSVGLHAVTVIAIDSGGQSTTFGPLDFTVAAAAGAAAPIGHIDSAVDSVTASSAVGQSDSVVVKGWTADQIDGAPLGNVKVYIDGNLVGVPTLGIARPDVAAAYNKAAYLDSGYTLSYPVAALSLGSHSVTVIAIDSGARSTTFGPLAFTVVGPPPFGHLDSAVDSVTASTTVGQSDSVVVKGWAADKVDGAPLSNVKVYIDGNLAGTPILGIARPDVAAADGAAYLNSGYQLTYSAAALALGPHAVTVIAIDSGGRSATLGPLAFTVAATAGSGPLAPPFGHLDSAADSVTGSSTVQQSDSLVVKGWAADKVDGAPLSNVKVYIDGNLAGTPNLGIARPDVAAAEGAAYLNSGYQLTHSAAALALGPHSVTVVAIDSGGRSATFGPLAFTVQ
jgi:streptogramin lyase